VYLRFRSIIVIFQPMSSSIIITTIGSIVDCVTTSSSYFSSSSPITDFLQTLIYILLYLQEKLPQISDLKAFGQIHPRNLSLLRSLTRFAKSDTPLRSKNFGLLLFVTGCKSDCGIPFVERKIHPAQLFRRHKCLSF
jgi:hypothetical protein